MPDLSKLLEMERKPEFAKQDYAAQQKLRLLMLGRIMAADSTLTPEVKSAVMQKYASRPPVFENPDVGAYTDELVKKIASGEASGFLQNFTQGVYAQGPAHRLAMDLSVGILEGLGAGEEASRQRALYDRLYGRDGQKVKDYLKASTDPASSAAGLQGLAEGLGTILGFIPNFMAIKGLPVVSKTTAVARGAVEKLASGTAMRSDILRGVLGNLAENTVESVALTAKDLLMQAADGKQDVLGVKNVAEVYGQNALLDYAIGTVGAVGLPFAKLAGRSLGAAFFPTIKAGSLKSGLPLEAMQNIVGKASTGQIAPEMLERLPAFFSDQTRVLQADHAIQREVGSSPDVLKEVPLWHNEVEARVLGNALGQDASGAFTLRRISDIENGLDKPTTYASLLEVQENLGQELLRKAEKGGKNFPLGDYGGLARVAQGLGAGNEVFNLAGVQKGFTPPALRPTLSHLDAEAVLAADPQRAFLVKAPPTSRPLTPLVRDVEGNALAVAVRTAPLPEVQAAFQRAAVFKAETPALRESVEELAVDSLRRAGYDSAVLNQAGDLAALYPSRVKLLAEAPAPAKILRENAGTTSFGQDAFIRLHTERMYKESEIKADPRRTAALLSGRGDLGPERVSAYVRAVLDDARIVHDVDIRLGPEFKGRWEDGKLRLEVPANTAPEARRALVRDLNKLLGEGGLSKSARTSLTRRAASVIRQFEIPGETYAEKLAWAQANAQRLAGPSFKELGGGASQIGTRKFATPEALADYLVTSRLSPDAVKLALAEDGFRLVRAEGQYRVLDQAGKIMGRGASIPDLLANTGWRPEKIPADFLPEVSVVDSGVKFSYTRNAISGDYASLMNHLNKYMNYKLEAQKRVVARTPQAMQLNLPTRQYEVVVPAAGVREVFENPQEASWFLRGGWAEYEGVKRVLARRGIPLEVRGGKYILRVGGDEYTALLGDKKEVSKLLSKIPDPQTAPALLGEEVENLLREKGILGAPRGPLPDPSNPPRMGTGGRSEIGLLARMGRLYPTPQSTWVQENLRKTGHTELASLFNEMRDAVRVVEAEHTKWRQIVREALSPGGKMLPLKKRQGIRFFLEAGSDAEKDAVRAEFKLTGEDEAVADLIRGIYGRNATDGLHGLFSLDPTKFIQDYVPRLRKAQDKLIAKGGDLKPEDIFREAFPAGVPRELRFFAEMDRISEVLAFDAEDDIAALLDRYITQGLKKKYLNPIWRKFDSGVKQARAHGGMDADLSHSINEWRATLMGFKTDGEKAVENFTQALARRFGQQDRVLVKDITRVLFTLQSFGTQAWKPWNVVRNLAQVYTVLLPSYGSGPTFRAMKHVATNTQEVLARMKEAGVLLDTPPLINSIVDEGSLAGRLVHKGLAGIKASDDYTRAVAYVLGEGRFDEGLAKLQRGVLKKPQEFVDYLQAYRMEPEAQAQLLKLVQDGKTRGARDLFARSVVEDTMFSYSKIDQPLLYRGMFGRLFGQFGVYSVQYLQNIKKGLTRGSAVDRAAYLTRLATAPTAIYLTLQQMGIAADRDFLPWSPAQFTGGPMWTLATDMLAASGSGYQADQARARLARSLPSFDPETGEWRLPSGVAPNMVPFYRQIKQLVDAYSYWKDGESWLGFLALTATPIRDDLRK